MNSCTENSSSACGIHAKVLALGEPRNSVLVDDLEHQGFKVEVVQGVDARKSTSQYLENQVDKFFLELTGKKLSKGEIACAIGHRRVYSEIIEERIPWTLVLEDDALLLADLSSLLRAMNVMDFEKPIIVSLYTNNPDSALTKKPALSAAGYDLKKCEIPATSAVAYVINLGACKALVSSERIVGIADWPVTASLTDFYLLDSAVICHPPDNSFLDSGRNRKRRGLRYELPNKLHHLTFAFRQLNPVRLRHVAKVLQGWGPTLSRYLWPRIKAYFLQPLSLLFRKYE